MADKAFSDLTAAGSIAVGDLLAMTDISDVTDDAAGTTKRLTLAQLNTHLASTVQTLTNKSLSGDQVDSGTLPPARSRRDCG